MLCPACKSGKMTFNKKNTKWTCEDCGYFFTEEYFLNDCVFWFCDECETYLNNQEDFDYHATKHVCRKCGYENDISFENIKGICTDCRKVLPDPEATLCANCRQIRRKKAKQWLIDTGKTVGVIAAVAGVVYLAAATDDENTEYTPLWDPDDSEGELENQFGYVTDSWIQSASEDELRATSSEMQRVLSELDYESDAYYNISCIHIDVVNAIASRFPFNLPHREHGWYLPNDD